MRTLAIALLLSLFIAVSPVQLHAAPPTTVSPSGFGLAPDVVDGGGLDVSRSSMYQLSDSIGEPAVGFGASSKYVLNSGYRQPETLEMISLSCAATASIGSINGVEQKTGSGACTVLTNAVNGYQMTWSVPTGSAGANTGSLIGPSNATISAYTPAVANTPETWSVAASAAEWGARLRSASTDIAAEWGVDGISEKWLNIQSTSRVIASRSSATPIAGSTEIIQFRAEVGASVFQPTGTYSTTVVFTVVSL